MASSRVGETTTTRTPPPSLSARARAAERARASTWRTAGTANASVLPDPVSATPMQSWPASANGHAAAWMGDGVANLEKSKGLGGRKENSVMGRRLSLCGSSMKTACSLRNAPMASAGTAVSSAHCVYVAVALAAAPASIGVWVVGGLSFFAAFLAALRSSFDSFGPADSSGVGVGSPSSAFPFPFSFPFFFPFSFFSFFFFLSFVSFFFFLSFLSVLSSLSSFSATAVTTTGCCPPAATEGAA